ncbi:MAG: hypothetical protein MUC61_03065, partial [Amoebophilaceae bacterium]|nr:hypothetical protein [Amoebophilaceae bacterium]
MILQDAVAYWARVMRCSLPCRAAVRMRYKLFYSLQLIDDVHFFIESFASHRDGVRFVITGLWI